MGARKGGEKLCSHGVNRWLRIHLLVILLSREISNLASRVQVTAMASLTALSAA